MFNVGDKVLADGRSGIITAKSTYGEMWPENVASKNNRYVKDKPVCAVLIDGETRPRNYFYEQMTKE